MEKKHRVNVHGFQRKHLRTESKFLKCLEIRKHTLTPVFIDRRGTRKWRLRCRIWRCLKGHYPNTYIPQCLQPVQTTECLLSGNLSKGGHYSNKYIPQFLQPIQTTECLLWGDLFYKRHYLNIAHNFKLEFEGNRCLHCIQQYMYFYCLHDGFVDFPGSWVDIW